MAEKRAQNREQFQAMFPAGTKVQWVDEPGRSYSRPCGTRDWIEGVEIVRHDSDGTVRVRNSRGEEFTCSCDIFGGVIKLKKKGIAMIVDFIKDRALKVANPDERNRRKAGLHDENGKLTQEGINAVLYFVAQMPDISKELNQLAKDVIEAEKEEDNE